MNNVRALQTSQPSSAAGGTLALSLAALGIVFGDLGTSPLYALQASFGGTLGVAATHANVIGIVSLFLWSLILMVSIKYVLVLMQADNHGEGGLLALLALLVGERTGRVTRHGALRWVFMAMFGTAMLYGDGVITPAISVLSAIEGIEVATPAFAHYTVPITVLILVVLFAVQPLGSGRVGVAFGPILAIWFVTIFILGMVSLVQTPGILAAFNPINGITFFARNGFKGFVALGAVVLCLTGGEALYADMGHFGKHPIRAAWIFIVMPALVLNYFGQGAMLIENPAAIENPFYLMAPQWSLYPLVIIATAATVIASQAVISGVFSVTTQAVSLGLLPRQRVEHSSAENVGQIYVPTMNWLLMGAAIALVLGFGSSAALAGAYGLAVSGAMTIVTPLTLSLIKSRTGRASRGLRAGLSLLFFIDIAFLLANLTKLEDGGWLPLASGLIFYWFMQTWQAGRASMMARLLRDQKPVRDFLEDLKRDPPVRVAGTAIFLDAKASGIPRALLNNIKFNRVIHERVVLLTVVNREQPRIAEGKRLTVTPVCEGIIRVVAQVGFMEKPNILEILRNAEAYGVPYEPEATTYFLSREELIRGQRSDLPPLRRRAFMQMARSAQVIADYYGLPPGRVVEIGTRLEI